MALVAVVVCTGSCSPSAPRAVGPSPIGGPAYEGRGLRVTVLDVGQGDAILVQFPRTSDGQAPKTMLVDAGDSPHGDSVVRALRERDVSRVDILVATHPHADHIGGMRAVLEAFDIGKVWDSGYVHGSRTQAEFLREVKRRGLRFGKPRAGFGEEVCGVVVEVLAPGDQPITGTASDANNNGIVLRLSYGAVSFLLAGDTQTEQRRAIPVWPRSTVLKVAHHGSRDGTDRAFLEAVAPQIAVISCGAGNPYGHPHPETMKALQAIGARTFVTSDVGTVTIATDGAGIQVETEREPMERK